MTSASISNGAAINQDAALELLTRFRRDLHRIPEVDFDLPKTLDYVRAALAELPCEVTEPCPSTICAYFDCGAETTTAIRTDMDALPVLEKSGVDFCSQHEGKMHACGHDGHMAMALGLAHHIADCLSACPETLNRNVLIVFQPAEETTGGAKQICESGVFERYNADRIFGFHLWPDLPLGSISSRPGPLLAATSEATFTFNGKASHIGKAADGADSLEASMRWLLEAYDYIAERQKEEPCLFKCGLLQSGQARNVISSRTYVEGSLRTYSDEMGARCKADLKEIAERRAAETRSTVEVDFTEGYPPVVNNPVLFALAAEHLPQLEELPEPLLIAEDFSFYQRHLPGMFTLLGTGTGIPLHADTFNFDEKVLVAGLETYATLIRIP